MLFTNFNMNENFITHDSAPEETTGLFNICIEKQNALVKMAVRFAKEKKYEDYRHMKIVKQEVATNSTLHRGYYCPSPIIDLVMGGVTRGKILKRPTKRSHISYRYFFNSESKLAYIQNYGARVDLTATEYIIHDEGCIYGITLLDGVPCAVSEERYERQRIISYTHISFACRKKDEDFLVTNKLISFEKYAYDDLKICLWDFASADVKRNYIDHQKYIFTDGNEGIRRYAPVNPMTGQVEKWYSILREHI